MSCILALVGCTQSNGGSPSGIWVHLQARDSLCMISQQYGASSAKIISFETNCCKLQKPESLEFLVPLPPIPQLKLMSLGSRTFLSALFSPFWSLCLSVPYTLGLCGSYPHSVLFISFLELCIRSLQSASTY